MTTALVLGGGGVAGIAWEAGIVTGLRRLGVDLGTADRIIGTSAGSVVGTLVATGADLEEAVAHQTEVDTGSAPAVDMNEVMQAFAIMFDPTLDPLEARRRVGQMALAARVDHYADRLAAVGERLPVKEWPERELLITSVDAATGEFVVWDRSSGAPLVLAVASSCAVPMVFPPVEINGRRYVDGGVRSATNADLAEGARALVVLEPLGNLTPRAVLDAEMAKAGAPTSYVVHPDTASVAVFGQNVLDPALWGPAFAAGIDQAAALAEPIATVWS
ncbi:patatin-like phospholipase family protein [Microbispora bryophytorum]|uniref:Patatin-like phospholipase family protein n=1 Tax=Microbispora bryophytorum subsp. camponoti TaxID=1677852 RepID=A0ABR8L7S8_9ACTN|nr:patatin-like phospholipase family protein [Microbispora camponoti]MBD3144523.1 patatin-like phospholipase family protein [Microbispora camponoti]